MGAGDVVTVFIQLEHHLYILQMCFPSNVSLHVSSSHFDLNLFFSTLCFISTPHPHTTSPPHTLEVTSQVLNHYFSEGGAAGRMGISLNP